MSNKIIKKKTGSKIHKKARKKRRKSKETIFGIIGMLLMAIAVILYFIPDDMALPIPEGPLIALAADRPNQALQLHVRTDETGVSDIIFDWDENSEYNQGEYEEVTFWIYIADHFEFEWKCDGDVTAVTVEMTGDNTFSTSPMETAAGRSSRVLFKINEVRGRSRINKIQIQNEEKDFKAVSGGTCTLRIPWISPWFNGSSDLISMQKEGDVYSNDIRIIARTIDGEPLYQPLSSYEVYAADVSSFDHNLGLLSVSPEARPQGLSLVWSGSIFFTPEVKYIRLNYDSIKADKTNLCFMVFGIGLSLFYEAIQAWRKHEAE